MTEPQLVKLKQIGLLVGILGVLTLVIHLFMTWTLGSNTKTPKRAQIQSIPSVTKKTDDSEVWMIKLETRLAMTDRRNRELEEKLEKQKEQLDKLMNGQESLLSEISQKIDEVVLSSRVSSPQPDAVSPQNNNSVMRVNDDTWPPSENGYDGVKSNDLSGRTIFSSELKLSDKNKNLKKNYLPSGTFVKAVILGGVDASTSITSQSEPRPVLLRLIDIGFMPNYARTNIQDCHIVAAAHGDISSERAYIRTERMSCTLKNGKIFESSLDGYVAGEDGKDGVRGKVLRREGDLLWNSFLAGTVSGLGKGMSESLSTTSISPLGATITTTGSDVLKSGALEGVGEGADRLQKYFIQRAEQYQPVIQVAAGREVTVIFTKGMSLDGVKL